MYLKTYVQYIKVRSCFGKANFWPSHALNMMHFHLFDTLTFQHDNICNLTICWVLRNKNIRKQNIETY